jgi:hypothetical protein
MNDSDSQKLRINICAQYVDEEEAGKFLVVVDSKAEVDQLVQKVEKNMAKERIIGVVHRLLNSAECALPLDERIEDVLRDAETVIAVVGPPIGGDDLAAVNAVGDVAVAAIEAGKLENQAPPDYYAGIPGPQEICEVDLQEMCERRMTQDEDWVVEDLTPRLREYVVARFRESALHSLPPSSKPELVERGAWITVLMRPHNDRVGAEMAIAPVQYNLARVDVVEFERLCGRNIAQIRHQIVYLEKCLVTLRGMLAAGAKESDLVDVLMPYKVREADSCSQVEEEMPILGQVEGFRPVDASRGHSSLHT